MESLLLSTFIIRTSPSDGSWYVPLGLVHKYPDIIENAYLLIRFRKKMLTRYRHYGFLRSVLLVRFLCIVVFY